MNISIIIPAYNEEKYIGECLAHVLKYKTPAVSEVIVVNNASTDETSAVARRYPGIKVVDEPRKGLTRARQRGLQEATGDLLAYIDADTRMPQFWLPILEREFQSDRELVCLSGPYDYYDLPAARRFLARMFWKIVAIPSYYMIGYLIAGGNFAAKKESLLKIGGFDRQIEFHGEDTNLAVRLQRVGKVKFMSRFFIWTSG